MDILLIGSGGREHALAHKISESPLTTSLYIAPGNPGTAEHGTNVDLDVSDFNSVSDFVRNRSIQMVVVGPEAPLVEGLADFLHTACPGLNVIGPSAAGAQLEGSKAYAKAFMDRHHIPTAAYFECTASNLDAGLRFLEGMTPPYVLKADGLAAGKGVLILDDLNTAQAELRAMLDGKFGAASSCVVIEAFLDGIEFSVFALTDGRDFILLPEAKDYKRIGEGDTGLNTGGMGAVSPVPFLDEPLRQKVMERIVRPTIAGLQKDRIDYKGFVFFGLINVSGDPFVIEYNCRLGDPETEVVLPRMSSDLVEAFILLHEGKLNQYSVEIDHRAAVTVVLVSGGYPGSYEKGKVILNMRQPAEGKIYHAGTKDENGQLKTNGGRVLALTSKNTDLRNALKSSLALAEEINFEGKYYRKDIGLDLIRPN